MIDIAHEQLLIQQAADMLKVSKHTIVRWQLKGLKGIKLETIQVGAYRRTSVEAIKRFQSRVESAQRLQETVGDKPPRRHQVTTAKAELAAAGI